MFSPGLPAFPATIILALGIFLTITGHAQSSSPSPATSPVAVFRELLNPVFNQDDVFVVRQVSIDREDLHVVLMDGTIALMQAVDGHVTGAFFEGEGEVTIWPPDRAEKTSLALFTGSGVLDQKFHTAYLRFLDDQLVREIKAGLRPAPDAQGFTTKWQQAATSLARADSLQLLLAMTNSGEAASRYIHMRLAGYSNGVFDVFFNSSVAEQISVAQASTIKDVNYYDTWTAFPMRSAREAGKSLSTRRAPVQASDFHIHTRVLPPTDLDAEAELTLSSQRSGQSTLILELSRYLKVSEVKADGRPVPFIQNEAIDGSDLARRGNDVVAVVLPAPLEKGRPVRLTLKYSGAVMFDAGGEVLYVGARGTWYPNPGTAFANYDLTFEYPAEWTLVATGKRVSSEAKGGVQVTRFVSEKPLAHAGFNLGKFETASAVMDGVVFEAYAARTVEQRLNKVESRAGLYPEPAREVRRISQQAASTAHFLSSELGEFPYSRLEITQMPALLSQSWPGLIYLSSMAFLTREERAALKVQDPFSDMLLDDLMLAHETAHQWWGDAVDWESYRDEWLVEALANYSALIMLEHDNPEKLKVAMEHYRKELLKPSTSGIVGDAGPVTLGPRLASSRFPSAYEPVVYGRGTWLIHMLRCMLRQTGGNNDALFFQALRNLLASSPNGRISTRELQRSFERVLPAALAYEGRKSLDWFFDGWINGTSIPELSLTDVQLTPFGGRVKIKGVLRQGNSAKDMVTAVPVYAVSRDGKSTFLAFVFVDDPVNDFELTAPAGTTSILMDPQNTVLRR